jgi:hypothetical protein
MYSRCLHGMEFEPKLNSPDDFCSKLLVSSAYLRGTYLLTPWSRVLLEKLTGSAASQEIPRIFGTRRFLTVLTNARHLSLTSANSIQSPQPSPTSWRSKYYPPSTSGSPQWPLSLRFPHQAYPRGSFGNETRRRTYMSCTVFVHSNWVQTLPEGLY